MKILCTFLLLLIVNNALAQKNATLQIDSLNIDAGLLQANSNFHYQFVLKNIGKDTAIIQKVETTCGGVFPYITKNKIAPGQIAKIICDYNVGEKMGNFNKTINVFTTAKIIGQYQENLQTSTWGDGEKFTYLLIKGNVDSSKDVKIEKIDFRKIAINNTIIYNFDDFAEIDSLTKYAYGLEQNPNGKIFNFILKNISDTDIVIENVQTSCGCVIPEWSKQAIKPNNTSVIKIKYNTQGRPGNFLKTSTIRTNRGSKLILISGNVLEYIPKKEDEKK
jgi:Protein of unknown function (DUF1573)